KGRILATLQTRRVARGPDLSEDEPEGPRDALSRRVSERGGLKREARKLWRGAPMVRRVSRLVPNGRRVAVDQLPARGPSPREQGFWRSGPKIRAHGLPIRAPPPGCTPPLRADLRPSRAG